MSANETPEEVRDEMNRILVNLQDKIDEINRLTRELKKKRKEFDGISPSRTEKILEEIKVPALELLK
ncbi:MAG: hypothetical protein NTZ73_01195 [Candidatus Diapherotrites archaeon]|nr:hypothetical protein [Candidatus Diapherotrites archaeon]